MKIVRAEVIVDKIVRFYLDDGTHVDRDFAFVSGEVYDPVFEDPAEFKKIKIRDGHPSWPGDVDLCPDALLFGRLGRGRRPVRFATVGARGCLWSGRPVRSP
jgi:hypothetical protein